MNSKKEYSIRQEQLARFAKIFGHPAGIAIIYFLAKQETCYYGDIREELPNLFVSNTKLVSLLPMIVVVVSLSIILLFDKLAEENR